ncbi:MAG: VOC family protein [Phycisphaerae bacterium]|nr:VOC family protein [Tepidisphaeraceae bacterium]
MSVTVTPHIACRDAAKALEFYQKAFGAEVLCAHKMPDGKIMHSAINIRGATVFVVDEFPDCGGKSPQALGGTPVTLHLQVPDVDATFKRAVDAGATVRMPVADMFWGDRYGIVIDPFGHQWSVATTIRKVSAEELQAAAAQMHMAGAKG